MTPDEGRGRWVALLVCCSALFMTLLDVSVTNVALPSISRDTHAASAEVQWIVSGYTLAFGLVPVLGGKLGDEHGRRLMFQVGVAGFALTSALSGLAPTAGSDAASYSRALGHAVIAAICFVGVAIAIGVNDLVRASRRSAVHAEQGSA